MTPPLQLEHSEAPWWRYRRTLVLAALCLVGAGFNAAVWLIVFLLR